jgi:hypothetical protein
MFAMLGFAFPFSRAFKTCQRIQLRSRSETPTETMAGAHRSFGLSDRHGRRRKQVGRFSWQGFHECLLGAPDVLRRALLVNHKEMLHTLSQ